MSFKIATIGCALLVLSTPAIAQENSSRASRANVDESSVDNGVANLTVRTAFTPSPSLSRQELFGLLLLMSVPREAAQKSMQGAKP